MATRLSTNLYVAKFFLSIFFAATCSSSLLSMDWAEFRGTNGDGKSAAKNVPTDWGPEKNVKWKLPLPGQGNGSPVVSDGKLFVTSANADGTQRTLHCIDAEKGKELWKRTVMFPRKMPTHKTNPFAGTTPACDGERVVVWHASAGLHCYDVDGNELWNRDFGEFKHMWGYGTSPVIHQDRVILHTGPGEKVSVIAMNIKDGEIKWQKDEPVENNGERNDAGQYMGSWSTPIIHESDGNAQVIVALSTRINAYDFSNGDLVWSCEGVRHAKGDLAYSSPVISNNTLFFTGGFGGPAFSVKLGGRGDVTPSHRLFRTEKNPQSIGTGIAIDRYVYRPNADGGTIQCFEIASGEEMWRERAGKGAYWGSMIYADGLLFVTDQEGATVIFKPNPKKFEQVAMNELKENTNATPAVANGRLYLRMAKNLYCIGE